MHSSKELSSAMFAHAVAGRAATFAVLFPAFERATLASVGLRSALAYAPDGRAWDADVAVTSNPVAERYVAEVIDGLGPLDDAARARLRERRAAIVAGGRPVERYRRLTTSEALALLASLASAPVVPRWATPLFAGSQCALDPIPFRRL